MIEITNIVGEIVSNIDRTIVGKVNNDLGKNTFCKTKWARKGKRTKNLDTNYVFNILYVQPDEYIDAVPVGAGTFGSATYQIDEPFYITGTKLATNREWTIADSDLRKKTPIIWLLETIQETRYGRGDTRDFTADLRMFFLDETNIKDFYTEDHRREVVLPMQELVKEFINTINVDKRFATVEEYRMRTFSRFGVEQENGMFQNILDANLSGVELNLSLTMYKENCKC